MQLYDRLWDSVSERILAERKARYEAERCPSCGCHPDEHANG